MNFNKAYMTFVCCPTSQVQTFKNEGVKIKKKIVKVSFRISRYKENFWKMKKDNLMISEVVERYCLNVIKNGKSIKILCPFHEEKTPSLILNDELGVYHCFGCGASGNIYTLIRWLESNLKIKKNYKSKNTNNSNLKKNFNYTNHFKEKELFSKLTTSRCLWVLQIAWVFYMENLQ